MTLLAGEAPRPHRKACGSLCAGSRTGRSRPGRISTQVAERHPGSVHCQKFPGVHAQMLRRVPQFTFLRPNPILSKHFGQKQTAVRGSRKAQGLRPAEAASLSSANSALNFSLHFNEARGQKCRLGVSEATGWRASGCRVQGAGCELQAAECKL